VGIDGITVADDSNCVFCWPNGR
jgi:hypothetical protein